MASPQPEKPARRSLRALARIAGRASGRGRGKRIQGFVDAVVRGDTIVGWARDTRDPTRRLEIQLLHGDEIMGFGIADLPRKDLLAAEMGDGRYGFRLRLSPLLLDGTSRNLRVCAITEQGKVPLERGSVTIAATATPEPAREAEPEPHALVGALERLNGRALHGWAFNPNQPDMPALVDVYDDERYLGSVMADRSRPRLYEKGFPSGARGFVFELPASGPGLTDRLRARVAGTMYQLKRARDFVERAQPDEPAAAPGERGPEPPPPPVAPPLPAAAPPAAVPRRADKARRAAALPASGGPAPIGLWPVGGLDRVGAAIADWAAQHFADLRVVTTAAAALPERLAGARIEGRRLTEQVARDTGFVLIAPAEARIDARVASVLATLAGFPDVVSLEGGRAVMSGEGARIETFLQPARPGMLAVRSDLLAAYPGNLERELGDGLLSPLRLWLAGRPDLRWTRIAIPSSGDGVLETSDRQPRAWRAVLADDRWTVTNGAIVPAATPQRLSIGLWAGWDTPELPALRALIAAAGDLPLDILVPTEGDAARGMARLAMAEAAATALGASAARTRIVDCGEGAEAICAVLLAAADGDCVLLSDGAAAPDAATLRRMAAWSLDPRVGMVGLATDAGRSNGAVLVSGETLEPVAGQGGGAAVDAVAFGLMMIAARCLGAIDGPAVDRYDLAYAPLEYGLRLARQSLQSVVVGGAADGVPAAAPGGPLPWHVAARLRADRLIG